MRHLRLVALEKARIPEAYPLIQAVKGDLTLAAWKREAESFVQAQAAGSGCGIMTLQDGNGLILGLFYHDVTENGTHGPVLNVSHFVAMDLISPQKIIAELAEGMEVMAERLCCRAVHTEITTDMRSSPHPVLEGLQDLGHRLERVHLCKPLPVTPGT